MMRALWKSICRENRLRLQLWQERMMLKYAFATIADLDDKYNSLIARYSEVVGENQKLKEDGK